jgi:hypothetical protein
MSTFDVKGEVHLRPYQIDAVHRLDAVVAGGARRVLVVAPTGAGKSVITGYIIARTVAGGQRVLVVAHRRELIHQLYAKVIASGIAEAQVGVLMASDGRRRPVAPVQVASIDTLRYRSKPPADVVIVDECFPAGTMIDGTPIERICAGDCVRSVNHATGRVELRRVTHIFRSQPSAMAVVHFMDGTRLVCTPAHPIFTQRGYVPACCLDSSDVVTRSMGHGNFPEEVRDLRSGVRAEELEQQDDAALLFGVQGGAAQEEGEAVLVQRERDFGLTRYRETV